MISLLKKKPKFIDQEYSELALMLAQDDENPVYMREIIDAGKLDYSINSLKHIDECLEIIRNDPPDGNEFLRLVLRYGAYVGEVIKRNSKKEHHWVEHKEAAKFSKMFKGFEESISTAGILWRDNEVMCFPLGKICKYIENGREDSVYFFSKVILNKEKD
ncbi:MAG: hypothetical protein ACQ9MH_22020 [Nitrospinales bacterium]